MSSKRRNKELRNQAEKLHFELAQISPLTENQRKVFESKKNAVLSGCAGSGKTFISSYLAYEQILTKKNYSKLIYVRSAVPTRNLGFLPGTEAEKVKVYETPYADIATELFSNGSAYEQLKAKKVVEFMTTSHIRGVTINDAVIIVDEVQNMTYQELDSIITRHGQGCLIFFCGDFYQTDLRDSGIVNFYKVLASMEEDFDFIEFGVEDVVRGELVKRYLKAKHRIFGATTNPK